LFWENMTGSSSRVDISVQSLALIKFRINSKRAIFDKPKSISWTGI
jgi:hypothetical protein